MTKHKEDIIKQLRNSGQTLTGDTLGGAATFNAQCFLIQHMFEIAPLAETKRNINVERRRRQGLDAIDITQVDPVMAALADAAAHSAKARDDLRRAQAARTRAGYTYIAPLLSDKSLPPSEMYSKLTQMRTEKGEGPFRSGKCLSAGLLDLTTDKMAMLVPRLRIYKVEYESEEFETKEGEYERRPKLDEAKDIEVIFDDFVRGASLEKMFTQRQGRLSGTGIKSFEWSLKGVNPADVDKNIEAKLVVHFNDVSDLFTDQCRDRQTEAGRSGAASFLDLIIYAPRKSAVGEGAVSSAGKDPDTPSYLLYNGKFFEIKIEVGWQVPPNISEYLSSEEIEAIRRSQIPLYLQLTKHQFNFKQDGSADLVINYRARYSNLDRRFDLYDITEDSKIAKALAEAQETIAEVGPQSGLAAGAALLAHSLPDATPAAIREKAKEQAKKLDPNAAARQRAERKENTALHAYQGRYNKLLKRLVGGFDDAPCKLLDVFARPIQLRMFNARDDKFQRGSNMSEYKKVMQAARQTSRTTGRASTAMAAGAEGAREFAELLTHDRGMFDKFKNASYFNEVTEVISHRDMVTSLKYDQRVIEGRIKESLDEDDKGFLEKSLVAGEPKLSASRPIRPTDRGRDRRTADAKTYTGVPITFFLLGDLIDTIIDVCENFSDPSQPTGFKEEIKMGRAGFITTDIEFIDVKKFYDTATKWGDGTRSDTFYRKLKFKELSFSRKDKDKLYRTINLASIPISYEYFVEWYINKVVKPKRGKYLFNHMINDVITELVAPALSSACFYGVPPTNYHISQLDFLADYDSEFAKVLYPPPSNTPTPQCHFISDLTIHPAPTHPALPRKLTANKKRAGEDDYGNSKGFDVHRVFKTLVMTTPSMLAFEQGNPTEDQQRGVYHFIVGASTGILKSATFTRVDAPNMREARVSRDRAAGAEQLRELYNVNLTLYGNPLIKPGQYIYVIPSPLGFGSPKSAKSFARFLGIGGYHLVTSVTNTISQKGYETKVTALHQALPYTETKDVISGETEG